MTASALPAPISWPPSEHWDGIDGKWSSFALRIGTPAQIVRVLISTAGQASWAIAPEGCPSDAGPACSNSRGDLFDSSQSSTWQVQSNNSLGLESNLYPPDNATFGLDSVALGFTDQNGGPTLNRQVVAALSGYEFIMGTFGLGNQPTNLTNFLDPHPSFLTSLRSQNLIPSLSWSYTAGAPYHLKGFYGSLTLGGYDASRFLPNNVSFSLAPDISRDLVVGVQSITCLDLNGTQNTFAFVPHLSLIDSTLPFISLPEDACRAFEDTLRLKWNSTYGMYIIDEELHDELLTRKPTINFTIGNAEQGGQTVEISLPYAALDLTYQPAFNATPLRYFPLQRADNDTQTTLGRAFLQEAYVIMDYDHSNFSVSQCVFSDQTRQKIVPIIQAVGNSTMQADQPSKDHGSRNTTGIILASVLGFCLVSAICLFFRHWLKKSRDRIILAKAEIQEQDRSPEILEYYYNDHESYFEIGQNSDYGGRRELHETVVQEMPSACAELRSSSGDSRTGTGSASRTTPGHLSASPGSERGRQAMSFRTSFRSISDIVQSQLGFAKPKGNRNKPPDQITTTFDNRQKKPVSLNRPLPPTPISESPQRLSYIPPRKEAVNRQKMGSIDAPEPFERKIPRLTANNFF